MSRKREQPDTRQQQPEIDHAASPKKTFVEPTISSPVDVLEATTFFQTVDSGPAGPGKKRD